MPNAIDAFLIVPCFRFKAVKASETFRAAIGQLMRLGKFKPRLRLIKWVKYRVAGMRFAASSSGASNPQKNCAAVLGDEATRSRRRSDVNGDVFWHLISSACAMKLCRCPNVIELLINFICQQRYQCRDERSGLGV